MAHRRLAQAWSWVWSSSRCEDTKRAPDVWVVVCFGFRGVVDGEGSGMLAG